MYSKRYDKEIKRKKYTQWNADELFYYIKVEMDWVKEYNGSNIDYIFEEKMTKYLESMRENKINGKMVDKMIKNDKILINIGFTFTERKKIKDAFKKLIK